jgi:serine/threonine protein kinase, bacterial
MNTFHPQTTISTPVARPAHRCLAHLLCRTAAVGVAAIVLGIGLAGCWDDSSDAPGAAAFSVGGSISGLTTAGLVLANGNDTASVAAGATSFVFPTALASGTSYGITVQTQPANASCAVRGGSGTAGTANIGDVQVSCATTAHSVGGTVQGLASSGLVLANGTDTLGLASGATSFTLVATVTEGSTYAVSIKTQPSGQTCSVGSGSGTMGTSNVTTVQVSCSASAYKVGGGISGLTGSGLILANGADTVSPAANATSYQFPGAVASGGMYSVTVQQQPNGQSCQVAGNYPATMPEQDVTLANVSCVNVVSTFPLLAGQETCPANVVDGVGGAAVVQANAMARDSAGNLYVLQGAANVVRTVTPAGLVRTIAGVLTNSGSAVSGNVDGTGAAAQFNTPIGLAIDSSGSAVLTETNDIRKVTPAGVVTTVAGGGSTPGYVDGASSAARFNNPTAIAFDSSGNAYVSDYVNCAIRKITAGGVVSTLAGGGTCGYADGTGSAAKFNQPSGLAVDSLGNVIVADRGTQTIRKVTPAGVVTTIAGLGAAVGWADGTGAAARFAFPNQISFDATGNLWVLDQSYSAIRVITPAGVVSTFAYEPGYFSFNGYTPPSTAKSLPSELPSMLVNPAGGVYVGIGCAIETISP